MSTLKKLRPEEYSEDRNQAMQELESKNKPLEEPIKKEIIKAEPDKKLIADIVKLYAKYYERARVETIMFYWEVGKRVNEEYGKPHADSSDLACKNRMKKGKFGASKLNDSYASLIKKLREIGIKIHPYDLRQARRFAVKHPQIQELIKQQDLSWNKIRRGLTQKKEQPKLTYNSKVFKSLESWNNLSTTLFKILSQLNPKEIEGGEKEEYLRILRRTKQKLEKRIKELEE